MQDQIFRERILRARRMTEADEVSQSALLHQHIACLRRIEGRNLFTSAFAAA